MTQLVTTTFQRFFTRQGAAAARAFRRASLRGRNARPHRPHRPDFVDTRPLVFRSEAFAEDLVLTHGAV